LAAGDAGAGLTGRLRVAAATTFARLHVVPQLPSFMAEHPELEIDMVLDDRLIDLVAEGVDLSLRMGTLSDSSAVAQKLASCGRSVLASPAYLERAGVPQRPADLAEHQVVTASQLSNSWLFNRDGAEISVQVHGQVRFSAAEGVRAAVLADMGLTIASDWMFADELATGAVHRVLTDWQLPSMDLWAVYPSGRMATAKARRFAKFVETTLHTAR
ncbi:MAG: substrate binding domain-containing protein, partial [Steroidobacteraceae bacterium]